jgi:hypothetical protein
MLLRPFLSLRSVFSNSLASFATKCSDNRLTQSVMRPWKEHYKRTGAVGIKLGMMSHYDEWGRRHPVTVLRVSFRRIL